MTITLTSLTPVTLSSRDDVTDRPTPDLRVARLEVGLAPRSEHNLVAGFEGIEGVFVATYEPLANGTEVDVTLCLPGAVTIEVRGTVDFLRGASTDGVAGMGIRLIGVNEADRALLETFAALREPLFHC